MDPFGLISGLDAFKKLVHNIDIFFHHLLTTKQINNFQQSFETIAKQANKLNINLEMLSNAILNSQEKKRLLQLFNHIYEQLQDPALKTQFKVNLAAVRETIAKTDTRQIEMLFYTVTSRIQFLANLLPDPESLKYYRFGLYILSAVSVFSRILYDIEQYRSKGELKAQLGNIQLALAHERVIQREQLTLTAANLLDQHYRGEEKYRVKTKLVLKKQEISHEESSTMHLKLITKLSNLL